MRQLRSVGLVGLAAIAMQVDIQPAEAQPAQAKIVMGFDVPAQALEDALDQYALEAGISLSLPLEGLGGVRSRSLQGSYTVDEGLEHLLSGTRFRFEKTGPSIYRVIEIGVAMPASKGFVDVRDVVIVSAKAPTTARDVPRDVVHIDGDELAERGYADDRDLSRLVSGLTWTNLGMGRDKIVLRGLSDGALAGRTQSLAGIYLDDTRITYVAPDPDLRLADIKGVEVLQGPQGALYGAGSLGGIVRIETHAPELDAPRAWLQASLATTRGGSPSKSLDVMINQPIIEDRLGLRAVLYDERVGGWLDNAGAGAENANTSRRSGGRLALAGRIDDIWSVTLTAAQQEISTEDSQYLTAGSGAPTRMTKVLEPHDNDFSTVALTVNGDWDWASLTSATSIVHHQFGSRFDATGAFQDYPTANVQAFEDRQTISMLLNETRLSSRPDAATQWLVGVFFADGDSQHETGLWEIPTSSVSAYRYRETRSDQIDELAVFGEITLPLSTELALSVGARLFRTSLDVRSRAIDDTSSLARTVGDRVSDGGLAPDIRLRYRLSDKLIVYASAAEGYRAGGVNTGGAPLVVFNGTQQPYRRYAGDELWTYELGLRGDFFDSTLRVNAILFRSDWRGLQSDMLTTRGFGFSGNAGDARINGAEVDLAFEPVSELKLNLHLLLNEPELVSPLASFPAARSGGLPGSSEIVATAGMRYDWRLSLFDEDTRPFLEATFGHVGGARLGFGEGQAIGDYSEIGLRAGIAFGRWRFVAYADNLADSNGLTFAIGNPYQPGQVLLTPQKPRTIGVSIQRTF